MNKTELVTTMANALGLPANKVDEVLKVFQIAVTDALKRNDTIELPLLGKFCMKARAARKGRNPKTGEPIEIAASKSARFKMGSKLKAALSK